MAGGNCWLTSHSLETCSLGQPSLLWLPNQGLQNLLLLVTSGPWLNRLGFSFLLKCSWSGICGYGKPFIKITCSILANACALSSRAAVKCRPTTFTGSAKTEACMQKKWQFLWTWSESAVILLKQLTSWKVPDHSSKPLQAEYSCPQAAIAASEMLRIVGISRHVQQSHTAARRSPVCSFHKFNITGMQTCLQ